jgi:hypothetical protein
MAVEQRDRPSSASSHCLVHLYRPQLSLHNLIDCEFPHRFITSIYIKSQAARRKPDYGNDPLRDPAINSANTDAIPQSDVSFSVKRR